MASRGAPLRWRWLAVLVALQAVWGGIYVLRTGFVQGGEIVFCLWDDAMISMRYARNLANGDGLVWNPGGERVQGFSNPGVVLWMAALHRLPVAERHASLLVQGTALALQCLSLALLLRLARRIAPESPALAPAAALAFVLCAPVQIWALQGADGAFVGAWLLACLSRLPQGKGTAIPPGLGIALASGAAIRPDASIFALAVILASAQGTGRRLRRVLPTALALAVVWVGLLAFGWGYYGDPLPNTWYLKAVGSPRALVLRSGLDQLGARLPALAPALGLAAFCAWRRRGELPVRASASCIVAALAWDVWTGGDWLGRDHASRYSLPALPLLLLLAIDGASQLGTLRAPKSQRAWPSRAARAPLAFAAGALLALLASPPAARREWLDPRAPTLLRDANVRNYRYALLLRDATGPDTSVAVHWAGVTPYFAHRPAIDVLGRSDRHIAKLRVERFLPGHSKWDWDYVLRERRPVIFVEATRGLDRRDDFRAAYLEARSRDGLDFFVRRDSLAKLLDPDIETIPLERAHRASPRAGGGGL